MSPGGRIDPADHLARPWRVHALAAAEGLALHDIWEVPTPLPADVSLAHWVEAFRGEQSSAATRALFAIRWWLGRRFGWDRGSAGFVPIYREAEEQLSRIENRTVTGFLHLSLVERRPRLAVYVRPHGGLGRAYMRLIEPFRRRVVYPALLAAGVRAVRRLAPR
ncbi:MAG TPA: DUF2867 domain-containing protein [Methylomirabilota bacterium]|jgi:hypothetical protein|nr:DUF2867 domain-containing protein [Methylomirabilota bacterium]